MPGEQHCADELKLGPLDAVGGHLVDAVRADQVEGELFLVDTGQQLGCRVDLLAGRDLGGDPVERGPRLLDPQTGPDGQRTSRPGVGFSADRQSERGGVDFLLEMVEVAKIGEGGHGGLRPFLGQGTVTGVSEPDPEKSKLAFSTP